MPSAVDKTPVKRAELGRRIEVARELFREGKVKKAREALIAIIKIAPADSLLELARTFDPHYISTLPSIDSGSEARRALSLYEEAITYGSSAAVRDRDRLRSTTPGLR